MALYLAAVLFCIDRPLLSQTAKPTPAITVEKFVPRFQMKTALKTF